MSVLEAIEPLLETVPQYGSFLTFEEVQERSTTLADQYPDSLRLERIGESKEGRPLDMLVVGNIRPLDKFTPAQGRRTAFIFGAPHPNEPHGVHSGFALAEYFAAHPDELQKFGFDTLLVLPAADVDGLILNEGAYEDFSPEAYLENYYRPPFKDQPEWSFPVNIESLGLFFDQPMQVTQALMSVMDSWQPAFVGSLHNSWTEEAAYFMSNRHLADFAATISKLSDRYNIPLLEGPNEQAYSKNPYPGVYSHASRIVETIWQEIRQQAQSKGGGVSSYDYLLKDILAKKDLQKMIKEGTIELNGEAEGHPSHLISEIPGFVWKPHDNPDHDRPSGMTRYEALAEGSRLQQENVTILSNALEHMPNLAGGPLLETVQAHVNVWNAYLQTRVQSLSEKAQQETNPTILTEAEAFQVTHVQPLMWLLGYIGILSRLANQEGYTDQADMLRQRITLSVGKLATHGELKVRPIHEAVGMQLGAVATAMYLHGQSIKQALSLASS